MIVLNIWSINHNDNTTTPYTITQNTAIQIHFFAQGPFPTYTVGNGLLGFQEAHLQMLGEPTILIEKTNSV